MKVDSSGRTVLASEWDAISNIPSYVTGIGNLVPPGTGDWFLQLDGDTDTWSFVSSTAVSVAASNVTYVSPGTGWPATDVQNALDDLAAAVDALQAGSSSGSFTGTWSNGLGIATFTVFYSITGNKCTIFVATDAVGTYISGTLQFTGLPAACRPAHTKAVPCTHLQKNGVSDNAGEVVLTNSTTVSIFLLALSGGNYVYNSSWSGTSGVETGWSATYDLS
jgi:hypothetical protein